MIDPSQFPRDLGTNLMAGQPAINDWLLADKTESGTSLLTTYEAILNGPRIKHPTNVPEPALKLDAALTDLDATLELTAGLVAMRPRMNLEWISRELHELGDKSDEFSNKRRDRLTQDQCAWQARVAALAAYTEPLTQHSSRIIDFLGSELGAINAVYEAGGAQKATSPATTYREISIECGKFRAAVNQFVSMVRADRNEHPSTDMAEVAVQDWIIETLGPRLRQLAMAVGTQAVKLPEYWPGADTMTTTKTGAVYPGGGVPNAPADIGIDQVSKHRPTLMAWLTTGRNEDGRAAHQLYGENLKARLAHGWMGHGEVHVIDQHAADLNASVRLLTDLLMVPAKHEMREIQLELAQLGGRDDAESEARKETLRAKLETIRERDLPLYDAIRTVNDKRNAFHLSMDKTMEALRDAQEATVPQLPDNAFTDQVLYKLPEMPGDITAGLHALHETFQQHKTTEQNMPPEQGMVEEFCWNVLMPRIERLGNVLRPEIPILAVSWPNYEALSDKAAGLPPDAPRGEPQGFTPAAADPDETPEAVPSGKPMHLSVVKGGKLPVEGEKIGSHMRAGHVSADVVDAAVASGQVRALFPKTGRTPGDDKS